MATDVETPILIEDFGTMARIVQVLLDNIGFKNVDRAASVPAALVKLR
jgi:hypothetical protein